jgi:hypothetical protein
LIKSRIAQSLAGTRSRGNCPFDAQRETEPWELVFFELYQSQMPIVEQAIEMAALMLGSDKSRGYCLKMIRADFLAGANQENENPNALVRSVLRFFQFLPSEERKLFLDPVTEQAA